MKTEGSPSVKVGWVMEIIHVSTRQAGRIVVGFALLFFAGTANAATLPNPNHQAWVNNAHIPTVNRTISVIKGESCPEFPNAQGCSLGTTIWLNSPQNERQTLFHELGHLAIREWFQNRHYAAISRILKWETFDLEQAAEGYALCAMKRRIQWAVSGTYTATPRQHQRFCQVFRRSASEAGQ